MSENYGNKYKTARDRVLSLLWDLAWHCHYELEGRIGGVRPSARLLELKRQGWSIEDRPSQMHHNGKDYRLVSRELGTPKTKSVKVFLTEHDAAEAVQGRLTAVALDTIHIALRSFRANKEKL